MSYTGLQSDMCHCCALSRPKTGKVHINMLMKNLFGVYCAKTHVDNRDRCSKIAKRVEKIEALSRDKRSRTRSVAGIETGSKMNRLNGEKDLCSKRKRN